jgi:hypothetical protein
MLTLVEAIRDRRNPYWPLPTDYAELDLDGQKQARLAVLCDQSSPIKLVTAWYFFRTWYLGQTENAVFYKRGVSDSPDFHASMILDLGRFGRNVTAAPRGSAKSTVLIEAITMLALTRPAYDIMVALATDKLVEERFDVIRGQLQTNELILEDFGEMRPLRGESIWSNHFLHLRNGSTIKGLSVMGKKRGGRPSLFVLDDPENDPDSDSEDSRRAVIAKFEMILFRQVIPMLESGSSAYWIGTLIDRKSFLYRATKGDDPRFDFWNRNIYKAIVYDKDDPTKCSVLWPEKWSREVLEARKEEIGPAAFASEYLNEPVSAQDRILAVDPRKNEYTVDGDFNWGSPLGCTNPVHWQERVFGTDDQIKVYEERTSPFHELVRPMFRILLFDYAYGMTGSADYSCIAIVGFDTNGTMWILHMWLGREKDDTLMRLIYEKGCAWQVRVLGIEAVSIQKAFSEAVQEYVTERTNERGEHWRGRVFPITYPAKETKALRMGSLEWRFNSARIKYPAHLQNEWPYNELYSQTRDFTLDLALLPHDDALDTISMSKHVIKAHGGSYKRERGKPGLIERIIRNQPSAPGLPLLSGVPSAEISDEAMSILSQKARERTMEPPQRRIERHKSGIYW